MTTTLISGGTILSPTGRTAGDVLVDGETIAAVLAPGQAEAIGIAPVRTIDATGKYVLPGGVDVHTHMELPFGGTAASDTFETGTTAAAWGGVTTIVDFAVQRTGERVQDGLADWHSKADGNCAIDYGFHMIIGGVDDDALKAMTYLVDNEGITSFKLFMAYPGVFYADDGQILRAMQNAGESGAMMMMHAENGIAIDVLVAQALARGETDPKYHAFTRPAELEGEATHRAIQLAKVAGNVPLYVVHMSASEALEEIAAARHAGQNVFAETCPQYLYLSIEDQLAQPGFEGAKWVCSTPLRSKHEHHQRRPLEGPADERARRRVHGPLPVLHEGAEGARPRRLLQDPQRHRRRRAPHGADLPGRRHRRALARALGRDVLHDAGPDCSGSTRPRASSPPAPTPTSSSGTRTGGRKIGVNDKHHMNMDHSAYEGFEVDGKVDTVLSRGTVVVENDTFTGTKGHGRYLKRGLSQSLV